MKQRIQGLLWVLMGGLWLMAGCTALTMQPTPSVPTLPTPLSSPITAGTPSPMITPLAVEGTLPPAPHFCTPVANQDEQLATLRREWPQLTWLPNRVRLCGITRQREDGREVIILTFQGEGRYYNVFWLFLRRHEPPRRPREVDSDTIKLQRGVEIHRSIIPYGGMLLTWHFDGFWIQLEIMGDALDMEEAIRIIEGIILAQ